MSKKNKTKEFNINDLEFGYIHVPFVTYLKGKFLIIYPNGETVEIPERIAYYLAEEGVPVKESVIYKLLELKPIIRKENGEEIYFCPLCNTPLEREEWLKKTWLMLHLRDCPRIKARYNIAKTIKFAYIKPFKKGMIEFASFETLRKGNSKHFL